VAAALCGSGRRRPWACTDTAHTSLVRPELGQALYDSARAPKRFVLVEGGSHHDTNAVGQPLYRQALVELSGLPVAR